MTLEQEYQIKKLEEELRHSFRSEFLDWYYAPFIREERRLTSPQKTQVFEGLDGFINTGYKQGETL